MASIILGPGEEFEHQHSSDSETILRRGKGVTIQIKGKPEREMKPDQAIRIPANTPHRIRNDGPEYTIVDCHHGATRY